MKVQFDTVVNYMGDNDIEEPNMEFNRAGWKEEKQQDLQGVIFAENLDALENVKQGYDGQQAEYCQSVNLLKAHVEVEEI